MIEVYLYGQLVDKVEKRVGDASKIMLCDFVEGERFEECLHRLGLKISDVGDCYINRTPANTDDELHDQDSLELNPIEKMTREYLD